MLPSARREVHTNPPAGKECGCMVVHMQERDLTVLFPQDHNERVHELISLQQDGSAGVLSGLHLSRVTAVCE